MLPKRSSASDIETLKIDFCNKYQTALPKRSEFVQGLWKKEAALFDQTCLSLLQTTQHLNDWFDPIDPMISISQQEVCDLHSKLFTSLKQKGVTSQAEYISFSYLITLDLYLNANQQEDYESCINSKMVADPKQYCKDWFATLDHPVFGLWGTTQREDMCIQAAAVVNVDCEGNKKCNACAIALAQVYVSYEKHVNDLYAKTFQDYEKQMFQSLDAENKRQQMKATLNGAASAAAAKTQLSQTNKRLA